MRGPDSTALARAFALAQFAGLPEEQIARLDRRDQALIDLRRQGRTFAEMAKTLGVQPSTVARRARRLCRALCDPHAAALDPRSRVDPDSWYGQRRIKAQSEFQEVSSETLERLSPLDQVFIRGRQQGRFLHEIARDVGRSRQSMSYAMRGIRSRLGFVLGADPEERAIP